MRHMRGGLREWFVNHIVDISSVNLIKSRVNRQFIIKDLGHASEFVGIALDYNKHRGTLYLNQTSTIAQVLKKSNMPDCKRISSPTEKHVIFHLRTDTKPAEDFPEREAIGSLLYIASCTVPIISHVLSTLAPFLRHLLQSTELWLDVSSDICVVQLSWDSSTRIREIESIWEQSLVILT